MAGQTRETVIDTTRRLEWDINKENFASGVFGKKYISSPTFTVKIGSKTTKWILSVRDKWRLSVGGKVYKSGNKIDIGLLCVLGQDSLKVEVEGICVKSEDGFVWCTPWDCSQIKKVHDNVHFIRSYNNSICIAEAGSREDFLKLFSKNKVTVVATLRFYMDREDYIENTEREKNFLARVRSISDQDTQSDFTVICGGREFKCHRVILSAMSTVFEAMLLNGRFRENEENCITIENSSPDIVEAMLEFMYKGVVPRDIAEKAIDLIGVANKYDLQDLIKICESSLVNNLTAENVINSLIAIDLHVPKSEHRQKIIDYIKSEVDQLVMNEEWKKFVQEYPDLVTEILLSAVHAPLKHSKD